MFPPEKEKQHIKYEQTDLPKPSCSGFVDGGGMPVDTYLPAIMRLHGRDPRMMCRKFGKVLIGQKPIKNLKFYPNCTTDHN